MKEHISIGVLKGIHQSLLDDTYEVGTYRPIRLRKKDGTFRRLHIPTMRDKVVSRAIADRFSEKLEPTFSAHSHAYRPNRSIDTALGDLYSTTFRPYVIVSLDVVGFFDQITHATLLRLLPFPKGSTAYNAAWKFITSTVTGEGTRNFDGMGIPQGLALSPVLSNLYLDGLDKWFEKDYPEVKYVRYADDIIIAVPLGVDAVYLVEDASKWLHDNRFLYFNQNKLAFYAGKFNWLGFDIDIKDIGT